MPIRNQRTLERNEEACLGRYTWPWSAHNGNLNPSPLLTMPGPENIETGAATKYILYRCVYKYMKRTHMWSPAIFDGRFCGGAAKTSCAASGYHQNLLLLTNSGCFWHRKASGEPSRGSPRGQHCPTRPPNDSMIVRFQLRGPSMAGFVCPPEHTQNEATPAKRGRPGTDISGRYYSFLVFLSSCLLLIFLLCSPPSLTSPPAQRNRTSTPLR